MFFEESVSSELNSACLYLHVCAVLYFHLSLGVSQLFTTSSSCSFFVTFDSFFESLNASLLHYFVILVEYYSCFGRHSAKILAPFDCCVLCMVVTAGSCF